MINYSTFSKNLLEFEMFGYNAGAFTGVTKDPKGQFKKPTTVRFSWIKLVK